MTAAAAGGGLKAAAAARTTTAAAVETEPALPNLTATAARGDNSF